MCQNKHNSVLHISRTNDLTSTATLATQRQGKNLSVSEQDTFTSVSVPPFTGNTFSKTSTVLLATAVAEIRDGMGNFQPNRVLLDSGS